MPDEILNAFFEIGDHISKGDTVDETLASAVKLATALVNCDECCTYVRQGRELVPWIWKHVKHGLVERTALPVDDGLAAALAAHRASIAVSNNTAKNPIHRVFEEWSANPGETFCLRALSVAFQSAGGDDSSPLAPASL